MTGTHHRQWAPCHPVLVRSELAAPTWFLLVFRDRVEHPLPCLDICRHVESDVYEDIHDFGNDHAIGEAVPQMVSGEKTPSPFLFPLMWPSDDDCGAMAVKDAVGICRASFNLLTRLFRWRPPGRLAHGQSTFFSKGCRTPFVRNVSRRAGILMGSHFPMGPHSARYSPQTLLSRPARSDPNCPSAPKPLQTGSP